MTRDATFPFTQERHELGTARSGAAVALAPMTPVAAERLAPAIARTGPWAHYGFSAETLRGQFLAAGDGAIRYQLVIDATPAGVVVIRSPWLAGPYLQMLAVLPEHQSGGVGSLILGWYEARARSEKQRNLWLCVTGINAAARRFYGRHGYGLVATLPDLIRDGDGELLMRKRL
jgi:ribosomal protein S18 acetylase RimI-like enzyme